MEARIFTLKLCQYHHRCFLLQSRTAPSLTIVTNGLYTCSAPKSVAQFSSGHVAHLNYGRHPLHGDLEYQKCPHHSCKLKCLCSAMMCHAQNSKFWLLEERLLFSTSKAQQQIVLRSTGQALVLSGWWRRWKRALIHFIQLISLHAHMLYFFSHFFYTEKC